MLMHFDQIKELIVEKFGEEAILKEEKEVLQPNLTIAKDKFLAICQELHENEKTYFDYLACITGLDNGATLDMMEVVYHLYSIPYNVSLVLKIVLPRNTATPGMLPSASSITSIWRTANWHEREIYDLLGIWFEGHPDMRRILLPADWEGHPLRKDYVLQEFYHDIKVKY